jgi:hypothetical protein
LVYPTVCLTEAALVLQPRHEILVSSVVVGASGLGLAAASPA